MAEASVPRVRVGGAHDRQKNGKASREELIIIFFFGHLIQYIL